MRKMLSGLAVVATCWAGFAEAECRPDRVEVKNDTAELRFDIELMVEPEERARGLMFREHLPQRAGMLFLFDPPQRVVFWMKNTLIPLDIIFLDQSGVVTRVHQNAIPQDLTPIEGGDSVFAVLEINAGLAKRYGIGQGTVLRHEIFSQGPAKWPC